MEMESNNDGIDAVTPHPGRIVRDESEKPGKLEEVSAAVAEGIERGGTQARMQNEASILISDEAKKAALRSGLYHAAASGAAAAGGMLVAKELEAGTGLPAPVTTAAHSKLFEAGSGSGQGGSGGSWDEAVRACAVQVAEDCAVNGVGAALLGDSGPAPTGMILERDAGGNQRRAGIEFEGNQYLSVGQRERTGREVLASGAVASARQTETGVQFRVSGAADGRAAGEAVGGSVGKQQGGALGSLEGISSNLGKTERLQRVDERNGDYMQKEETVHGFAGGGRTWSACR